ncbi:YitT family protein [Paenibacillus segetis]|uniref:Membrane protein n=1 Tax=Paenibacillus segetis TaxID=1325360 RepID=A0ABQ1YQK3_9BACL|nr:YitT family protein [Paenibacillus segetis]GGH34968.1 membrane protein [Paenibacillus segetis]
MRIKLTTFSPVNIRRLYWRINSTVINILGVIVGALLASIGLELFLMPHGIVVGGITGLSAVMAFYTEMRLGLFLFLLNLPLVLLQRRNISASFSMLTVIGLLVFSISSIVLHPFPALTTSPIPAALGGGISLGFGIGLAVRFGGTLDTVEKTAEWIHFKLPVSADLLILILNCHILIFAGFYFGFEQALYSVIAYILAFETVKIPISSWSYTRTYTITSHYCHEIQEELLIRLNRQSTLIQSPQDGDSGILLCKSNRLEETRLKAIVKDYDRDSTISIKK